MRRTLTSFLTYVVMVSVLNLNFVSNAQAVMIGTDQSVAITTAADDARARVKTFLSRGEVRDQMAGLGVNVNEAVARVDAMTDEEVVAAAGKLDGLPAGGDALGTLVGAAVLIFIVLLITDILGFTKVFPFTRSIQR